MLQKLKENLLIKNNSSFIKSFFLQKCRSSNTKSSLYTTQTIVSEKITIYLN